MSQLPYRRSDDEFRLGLERSLHESLSHKRRSTRIVGVAKVSVVAGSLGALSASHLVGALVWFAIGTSAAAILSVIVLARGVSQTIALHADGLLVRRARGPAIILFKDVQELWIRSPRFALAKEIRFQMQDGTKHRIVLDVLDSEAVVAAVLDACSGPRLASAESALERGESLRFGHVLVDPEGITIRKSRRTWASVRLARHVQEEGGPAWIFFYGSMPIFAWRAVRLDCIPHPEVFLTVIRRCAPHFDTALHKMGP